MKERELERERGSEKERELGREREREREKERENFPASDKIIIADIITTPVLLIYFLTDSSNSIANCVTLIHYYRI